MSHDFTASIDEAIRADAIRRQRENTKRLRKQLQANAERTALRMRLQRQRRDELVYSISIVLGIAVIAFEIVTNLH